MARKAKALYLFDILTEMVMKETVDGFQGGQQIRGRIVTNLCYADDIILLATWNAELQERVYCLDWVSHKYSLLINVDKTKVMASDSIACRILNSEWETGAGGYIPIPWVPEYRKWLMYDRIPHQIKQGKTIGVPTEQNRRDDCWRPST